MHLFFPKFTEKCAFMCFSYDYLISFIRLYEKVRVALIKIHTQCKSFSLNVQNI